MTMWTVKEVSRLTGCSVRTLHHYDAIGLLKPTKVTGAGYRLYDDRAMSRLQTILLFRELQFPLKDIKAILDSPGFDRAEALRQQIGLLELQRRHIEGLITFARELLETGGTNMNMDAFDTHELDRYKAEAKARWGTTEAYRTYARREEAGQIPGDAQEGLMAIFAKLGELRHLSPSDPAVQDTVKALQDHITASYYPCTEEILASLGQMYTGDDRFRHNIDAAGGEGTAQFAGEAIAIYCGGK